MSRLVHAIAKKNHEALKPSCTLLRFVLQRQTTRFVQSYLSAIPDAYSNSHAEESDGKVEVASVSVAPVVESVSIPVVQLTTAPSVPAPNGQKRGLKRSASKSNALQKRHRIAPPAAAPLRPLSAVPAMMYLVLRDPLGNPVQCVRMLVSN